MSSQRNQYCKHVSAGSPFCELTTIPACRCRSKGALQFCTRLTPPTTLPIVYDAAGCRFVAVPIYAQLSSGPRLFNSLDASDVAGDVYKAAALAAGKLGALHGLRCLLARGLHSRCWCELTSDHQIRSTVCCSWALWLHLGWLGLRHVLCLVQAFVNSTVVATRAVHARLAALSA
jgi:hypothetical protein